MRAGGANALEKGATPIAGAIGKSAEKEFEASDRLNNTHQPFTLSIPICNRPRFRLLQGALQRLADDHPVGGRFESLVGHRDAPRNR